MNYIMTKEVAKIWKITDRMLVHHCSARRIKRAKKMVNTWLVHADTEKLADGGYRSSKIEDGENK
ncbi:DNA-binding protein [Clostridium tagluense]|uniref:DNA-binding protein n=1 Tax=Clostridium tagluense TaxID=360422 RepID=UPI001C0D522B|nr:DNA-binding protein [Clostridium tagluense]MBU3129997.1 DNA-binding protein [Clostridium tagluense]MCB2311889.1 DNA-binding protein [Clostridium tagluense]MCB2317358.1 DNA-binding protein [Clostridium tagluense]MCB2322851.1 DNA-binding protein [Clostridium tagluense]MCB2326912.1 DNA-binding protein [Clostridium tagluense]